MIVMKFGGTSVGNAERIKQVSKIVQSRLNKKPVVVVSAFNGVTDHLIKLANAAVKGSFSLDEIKLRHFDAMDSLGIDRNLVSTELAELESTLKGISLLKELTPRTLDAVMSFGERLSAKIIAAHMAAQGLKAKPFNAYDLGVLTDSNFGDAEILEDTEQNIVSHFSKIKNELPVITGFLGKTKTGEVTTLGRGGSDYTASIIGSTINAETVEIWTDVNGIMSADPKIVEDAKTLDVVSYNEASELAFLGAKVLHPKTIRPAVKKGIPVVILNTYNPDHRGTTIVKNAGNANSVVSIVCKKNVTSISINSTKMFLVHGFLRKIFEVFDSLKIPVDIISTSEVNVSVTIVDGKHDIQKLVEELKKIADIDIRKNRASISVVIRGLDRTPGISGKIFSVLGNEKINVEMISLGASKINMSLVVKSEDAEQAVKVLHEEFYGSNQVEMPLANAIAK